MKLTRLIVPNSKYNIKCPYNMKADGICVHNTANKASAMAEISYMVGNNNEVSYHYAVDDYRIVQGIEENRNAWHAGDGWNGKGNRNKIAIEICYSNGNIEQFKKSEKLTAKFIAYKLKEKGWGIERVSKHQDYMNKYCPHKTLDLGWERFLNLIRKELGQAGNVESKPSKPKEPDYTGVITYQAYTDRWLPEVHKCDNTDEGFAGIGNELISGFRCKPQYGDIIYEAHLKGGNWLGAVNSKDYKVNDLKSISSYAGIYGKPIDGIRIKSTKGYVKYRVHIKDGNWLEWVDSRTKTGSESYAGIYGKAIDRIQMY